MLFHRLKSQALQNNIFKLKDGITLDSLASYNDEIFDPLRKMLNTNRKLIEYISRLDFRKIIIKKIEALGGKVTGSVTGKTFALINNDATSNSSKNKKARELGVQIITESEFLEQYVNR